MSAFGAPRAEAGRSFALLSLEIRRYERAETRITSDIEGRIVNRCVLSALEVLTEQGAGVDLAGTAVRPVIEAKFDGPDSPAKATQAALAIVEAVRRVQRARENEFQVLGALAVGTEVEAENGATMVKGPSDGALSRLRERAAPGQILLSPETRAASDGVIESDPLTAGNGSADTFVLRGIRE